MDFPGLTATLGGGCTGTFYASNFGIHELTGYDGQWNPSGQPNCNRWTSASGVGRFTWVLKTSTTPPQLELTFTCGSADTATYVKTSGDSCPTGNYALSSRSSPGLAITWPSSLQIFNTTYYQPASLPTTLNLSWDASTLADPAYVTGVTVTSGSQTISDYGKVQSCQYSAAFKRNPADAVNIMSALVTWSCQGGMTINVYRTSLGLGSATTGSYQMTGGNPARMWPTSGSVFHCVVGSGAGNFFSGPSTAIVDITVTY